MLISKSWSKTFVFWWLGQGRLGQELQGGSQWSLTRATKPWLEIPRKINLFYHILRLCCGKCSPKIWKLQSILQNISKFMENRTCFKFKSHVFDLSFCMAWHPKPTVKRRLGQPGLRGAAEIFLIFLGVLNVQKGVFHGVDQVLVLRAPQKKPSQTMKTYESKKKSKVTNLKVEVLRRFWGQPFVSNVTWTRWGAVRFDGSKRFLLVCPYSDRARPDPLVP